MFRLIRKGYQVVPEGYYRSRERKILRYVRLSSEILGVDGDPDLRNPAFDPGFFSMRITRR